MVRQHGRVSKRTGRRRGRVGGKYRKGPGDLRGEEASAELNGPVIARKMTDEERAALGIHHPDGAEVQSQGDG